MNNLPEKLLDIVHGHELTACKQFTIDWAETLVDQVIDDGISTAALKHEVTNLLDIFPSESQDFTFFNNILTAIKDEDFPNGGYQKRRSIGGQWERGVNRVIASNNPGATLWDIKRQWGHPLHDSIEAYLLAHLVIGRDKNGRIIPLYDGPGQARRDFQKQLPERLDAHR